MGKIKFGVFLPFYYYKTNDPNKNFRTLVSIVRESEKLGYHSAWLDDHLMFNNWPILECWTTLSSLSSLTSKIRLGTMVSCLAHRNPALLAKEAATFDILSGGRLEFGIGAGCQELEHNSYGLDFPQPKERAERLAEALEVIRRLWTQRKADYQGQYYWLKNAICEPKPLQKPNPPIIVGGASKLLLEKATAPYADRFDFGFLPSVKDYQLKLKVLETQCKAIGRNFDDIEKSCWPGGQVLIAQNQKELAKKIKQKNVTNLPLCEFRKTTLSCTPNECVELLQVYLDLGVTFFMLYFVDLPSVDGLRLFAKNVMGKMS